MSLLAAIVDWGDAPLQIEHVRAMLTAIPGRTPDGFNVSRVPQGLMGYGARRVRPAEKRATQPFSDDQRKIYGVGDVRLDNRDDLRRSLTGSRYALDSDMALVIAAYNRWGQETAGRLVGDFAFVIWDGARREVYAARDPFGVRSLVYWQSNTRLSFATEPAQFLPLRAFDRSPNKQIVVDFLSWSYARYGSTFFGSVRALRPGHFLWATGRRAIEEKEYFRPPELISHSKPQEYEEEFRALINLAVRDRLDSEYPIVAHLSGGLDSSTIVFLAHQIYAENGGARAPFHLASAVFPGKAHDETPSIREATRHLRFESHYWDGNVASGRDFLEPSLSIPGASVAFNGGSVGDLEIASRLGARVILSGDPGDSVTGENGLFNELLIHARWLTLARVIMSADSRSERRGRLLRLKDSLREETPGPLLAAWRSRRPNSRPPAWLRSTLSGMWLGPEFRAAPMLKTGVNRLQQRMWDYLRWTRLFWAIDRLDRYAASGGAEMRFPFLDVRLVRFILSVPVDHRLPKNRWRWLHREAMAGVLPESIRLRGSKPTFNRAVVDWGHCSLSAIRDMLAGPTWFSDEFVDRSALRRLVERLASRPPDRIDREGWLGVRAVVHLEAWLRAVFRYPHAEETPSMSDVRLTPTTAETENNPEASRNDYVAPKLTPVGNVREMLATDGAPSDDGVQGLTGRPGS
jgi:asparagine synthase (glutamine-hydrolysing)